MSTNIRISFVALDAAIATLSILKSSLEGLPKLELPDYNTGPGSEAIAEAAAAVESTDLLLCELIGAVVAAISSTGDAFSETDTALGRSFTG